MSKSVKVIIGRTLDSRATILKILNIKKNNTYIWLYVW